MAPGIMLSGSDRHQSRRRTDLDFITEEFDVSRSEKRRKQENRDRLRGIAATQMVHARRTKSGIEHAAWLIEHKRWQEARDTLEECDRLQPGRRDVLHLLLEVYEYQQEFRNCCRVCTALIASEPGNRPLHLLLASAYLGDMRPVAALLAARRYVERWPGDPDAGAARELISSLEPGVSELLSQAPFPAAEKLELAELHEKVMAGIAAADFASAIRSGEQLLSRCPDFVPAMNNLALAYHETGRTDAALDMSLRVLQRDADNYHALSNLVRHLVLSGRQAEAESPAARLRTIQSDNPDSFLKKAEAFSFLGDDQAVLEAVDVALRVKKERVSPTDFAFLHHLAAVAHARRGNSREALRLWRASLKHRPGFELARDNLEDAQRPVGMRHGPWPYSMNYWIRRELLDELAAEFEHAKSPKDDAWEQKLVVKLAARHPEIVKLIPLLLDRGDELARGFARRLAAALDTPECLEALRSFSLSQRGPDKVRIDLANELVENGVLSPGAVRLWIDGAWADLELLGLDVSYEHTDAGYSDSQTIEWLRDAVDALGERDGTAAERLVRQCLASEGDRPELLNNLAAAVDLQGRHDEALQLARQIHARWPDYFFGRAAMANLATADGDFERAEALLAGLRRQRKFHHTEFTALCEASLQLFVAQRKFDVARSWLKIWNDVQPGHPRIDHFERVLAMKGAVERVKGWLPFGKKHRTR